MCIFYFSLVCCYMFGGFFFSCHFILECFHHRVSVNRCRFIVEVGVVVVIEWCYLQTLLMSIYSFIRIEAGFEYIKSKCNAFWMMWCVILETDKSLHEVKLTSKQKALTYIKKKSTFIYFEKKHVLFVEKQWFVF